MNLKELLKIEGREKIKELCAVCGTNYAYYKHMAAGRRRPSIDLARRMIEASNERLTLKDLIPNQSLARQT